MRKSIIVGSHLKTTLGVAELMHIVDKYDKLITDAYRYKLPSFSVIEVLLLCVSLIEMETALQNRRSEV